ncbi:rod shape-determining protein [Patescibacteria group bacterium]
MNFLENIKSKADKFLSNDVGIDLGTANTLVYINGKGIVLNEPSVVAVNQKTGQVVAVGTQAKQMIGRTPSHITAVRPLVDGVISDFEITGEMISYLINKSQKNSGKLLGPRVIVGVPSGITNVETRAVRDSVKDAGAKEVYIVEEPMAAAIGSRLPVNDPVGNVIVDIGGGTSDIAVISLGGIVSSKNLRIAGDKFNENIISYVRDKYKVLIGEKTAEGLKMAIGSMIPSDKPQEALMRGRDLITGLPREIIISDTDMRKALMPSIDILLDSVKGVLEATPPEIISDIIHRGVFLAGGGALIGGFDKLLSDAIQVPVHIVDDPLTAVARGTGIILEDIDTFKDVLIQNEDELPIKI